MWQVDIEMQKKEVSSLQEEVETLKSSLMASRTENSMLKSRIEELNAGQDPDGSSVHACGLWVSAVSDSADIIL
jgi:predicted RNase H-like nuclease (RuvC/YqgF family)